MAIILIVDDRAINREFLASLLRYFGHNILEAANGVDALQVAQDCPPDLVISDVLMPKMDGIELANALRENPRLAGVPVIFYTATFRLTEAASMAKACGVTTVIAKPADPQEILCAVNNVLGQNNVSGQNRPVNIQEAIPWTRPPSLLGGSIPGIAELQQHLQRTHYENAEVAVENDNAGNSLPFDILRSFNRVHSVSLRLAAALELGLELSSQSDPQQILNLFCRAVREILGAEVAIAWMVNESASDECRAAYGVSSEAEAVLALLNPRAGVFAEVMSSNEPLHLDFDRMFEERLKNHATTDVGVLELNRSLASGSALLLPVGSSAGMYGWIYLSNKLNHQRMAEDDVQFAAMLATQLAMAYGNRSLLNKVQRKAEALERSEERFRRVVEGAPNAILMVNPSGRIEMVNAQVEFMFGYLRADLIDRPVETIIPHRYREQHEMLRNKFFTDPSARPMAAGRDLYGLRSDGDEIPVEIRLSPIMTETGLMVLSTILDISDRKRKEAQIQANLKEKDILLAEVHHRVRNNLQIISSLFDMQYSDTDDPRIRSVLLENRDRINAMALVHRLMDQSPELDRVNFVALVELLAQEVAVSQRLDLECVAFSINVKNVPLSITRAIPGSLIVNELLTIAFNRFDRGNPDGKIYVKLDAIERNEVMLVIGCQQLLRMEDQGQEYASWFSTQLVTLLAHQINGQLSMNIADTLELSVRFSDCNFA